jgi:hypothetical protein
MNHTIIRILATALILGVAACSHPEKPPVKPVTTDKNPVPHRR